MADKPDEERKERAIRRLLLEAVALGREAQAKAEAEAQPEEQEDNEDGKSGKQP